METGNETGIADWGYCEESLPYSAIPVEIPLLYFESTVSRGRPVYSMLSLHL